jgi:hypothetical protein
VGAATGLRGFGAAALLLAAAPARALVIDASYDTSVTSSPSALAIENAFGSIVSSYDAMLTDNVNINVTLTLVTGSSFPLGENDSQQVFLSYSEYLQLVESHALTTGNQAALTALATEPMGNTSPFLGLQKVEVSTANARALGYNQPETTDGDIMINAGRFSIQYTRNGNNTVNSNEFDFTRLAEHELDEVLGFGSALVGGETGVSFIRPEDLFRYEEGSTTRSFTLSSSATVFLSINGGASDLVQLSQDPNGDYGDFFSPGPDEPVGTPCSSNVQAAFTCPGTVANVTTSTAEGRLFAALGYSEGAGTPIITTWTVNCTTGTITGTGVATVSTTGTLGALLGTPTSHPTVSPAPQPGDLIEVIGACVEDVTIRTPALTLTNHNGPDAPLVTSDPMAGSIEGQIEIAGVAGTVIDGLVLGNNGAFFSFQSASDQALVYAHDGAGATVENAFVILSPDIGILAANSSQVRIFDSQVLANALNNNNQAETGGIVATGGSKIVIGTQGGSIATAVYRNGGDGIALENGSSLLLTSGEVSCNLVRQIRFESGSSGYLSGAGVVVNAVQSADEGSACNSPTPTDNAIALLAASNLRVDQGASVTAVSGTDAVLVGDGSALLLQGSTITAPAAAAVIVVDSNGVVALAGGNSICSGSCSGSPTGNAFQIQHVGSFIQVAASTFGYTAAEDLVFGGASLQLQSTADLGVGPIGSNPSLAWTAGSGGVNVSQNSSFRLEGGVSITGALLLSQGSNAFFNGSNGFLSTGVANVISGNVTCPFTAMPASHVSGPKSVSPSVSLSTNFFSTSSPTCLSF